MYISLEDIKIKEERLKELNASLNATYSSVKETPDAKEIKRSFSDAELATIETLKQEIAETEAKVKTAKELLSFQNSEISRSQSSGSFAYQPTTGKKVITRSDMNNALAALMTSKTKEFKAEYGRAAEKCDFDFESQVISIPVKSKDEMQEIREIRRSANGQTIGTAGAGGYTLPDEVGFYFTQAMDNIWDWKNLCTVNVGTDADFPILYANDTGVKAAYTNEAAAAVVVDIAFVPQVLKSYYFTSALGPVSFQLENSSRLNLPAFWGEALGKRQGRAASYEATVGTGRGNSHWGGYVTGAVEGGVADADDTLDADEIHDFIMSFPKEMRNDPTFRITGHSKIWAKLSRLRDSDGNRVVSTNPVLGGRPEQRLLDYLFEENDNMADTVAAGAKVLCAGVMASHQIKICQNTMFRQTDQIDFLKNVKYYATWFGGDSMLINPGDNPMRYFVMAAS